MLLPTITTPPGTPEFLASGHDVAEDSVFVQWKAATGHSRARRVWTVTERVVNVEWFLEPGYLEAVEGWFETTLQVGARLFSARVRNEETGPLLLWWAARWISIQYDMLPLGRARVSGSLMLFGGGSTEPPEFGLLSAEFAVTLDDVPAAVHAPSGLNAEFLLELRDSARTLLAIEILVDLAGASLSDSERAAEDGTVRETEDAQTRLIEG